MAEDLYSDAPENSGAAPPSKPPEKDYGSQTFMVPKAVFGGKDISVGSTWDFDVVGLHDDEVEMKYSTGKKDTEKPMPSKPMAKESSREMDALME